MARNFRLYEKKRGHRRTGSSKLGRAGELFFFAAFALVGCGGLAAMFAFLVVPEWRVNHEFVEHRCVALATRVAKSEKGKKEASGEREGTKDATEEEKLDDRNQEAPLYRPEIEIRYEIEGVTYKEWTYDIATVLDKSNSYSSGKEAKQAIVDRFIVDKEAPREYPCWYDPADPKVVVLVRGYSWWIWPAFIVPVSFLLIGGGGFVYAALHWGKSTERCAAMAQRAQDRDLFGTSGRSEQKFPNIPDGADITNSPGTRLRFRLPIGTSPGWALFGTLLACLFWNGIVSVFAVFAVRSHLDGRPDWFLTLFIIPFVLVGIGILVFLARQVLVATGTGPTLVEISEHPLVPGGQYRLFLSQAGRLTMNSLDVTLVCEEQATYRQGTDTRTETRQVYRQGLFRREAFEVEHGLRFETECEFTVPAGVMHSFKASHNEINWSVLVQGDVAGWPDFKRAFSVVIRPGNGSNGA